MNFIRKYLDNKKLQSFQLAFYEETTDPKRAYYYLRVSYFQAYLIKSFYQELNRQKNFELVTDIYEKYKSKLNQSQMKLK